MSEDIKVTDGTVLETLNNKVDIDFNNVASNSVGFARMSREITNCITEIPQRIKYTLNNGTLTIKAGSVVIVPYGVEDKTSQFPVGATFINDNFKVYDTCYADGKFFVWAELVGDAVRDLSALTSKTGYRVVDIDFSLSSESIYIGTGVNGESGTGSTASATYTAYYNTNTNFMYYAGDTTTLTLTNLSFPFIIYDVNTDTISQVFNGFGYIGSTIWVDKGVKGLVPNGRNEDGSLKNVERITPKIVIKTWSGNTVTGTLISASDAYIDVTTTSYWIYDAQRNMWIHTSGSQGMLLSLGDVTLTNGKITNFQPKQPFRAVDYSEFKQPKGFGSGVSFNSGWTATGDGLIVFGGYSDSKGAFTALAIDGQQVHNNSQSGSNANHHSIKVVCPVLKGQVVTYSGSGVDTCYFIPYTY